MTDKIVAIKKKMRTLQNHNTMPEKKKKETFQKHNHMLTRIGMCLDMPMLRVDLSQGMESCRRTGVMEKLPEGRSHYR